MTPNNEVKAPRPCTLWGQTFECPSHALVNIVTWLDRFNDRLTLVTVSYRADPLDKKSPSVNHNIEHPTYQDRMMTTNNYVEDAHNFSCKLHFEAIQAIASAQCPWLKAEGFEFVKGVV
jgi:hypothetical protein